MRSGKNLYIRYGIGLAMLLSWLGCTREKKNAADIKRPNVVFILTDDQRWDALGVAGTPHLETPHIDRLAAEGVRFKNYFCTTSLCSPSRASILSGLYAHAHGVQDNFTEYPAGLPSFPGVLQAHGYETAYIGSGTWAKTMISPGRASTSLSPTKDKANTLARNLTSTAREVR